MTTTALQCTPQDVLDMQRLPRMQSGKWKWKELMTLLLLLLLSLFLVSLTFDKKNIKNVVADYMLFTYF